MIIKESEIINETLETVARQMVIAARTAPKARGKNFMSSLIVTGDDIFRIADKMEQIGNEQHIDFFLRDAQNIRDAPVVVFFGTSTEPLGLNNCGRCGHNNCDEKRQYPLIPCVYPVGDLGIAVGSAVSVAMNHRVDNRIMFSVGRAAKELGLFAEDVKIIYGVPLSATSKNIFFDRAVK